MVPLPTPEVKSSHEEPCPIPPTEEDLRKVIKQLDWLHKRFDRAKGMVKIHTWEFHIFNALGMAIDQSHPLLRKVRDKYMGGNKYDTGKPRIDLVPGEPIRAIARALGHGAEKYGDHNWRQGFQWSRLYAATLRHLLAFNDGEGLDKDSGLPHLAHAACELFFLIEMTRTHPQNDDRYRAPATIDMSENLTYAKIQEEAKRVAEQMREAQTKRPLATYEEYLESMMKKSEERF